MINKTKSLGNKHVSIFEMLNILIFCTIFVIVCIYGILYINTERIDVIEKVTLKGVVIDSGCVEKYINHPPTNYKTPYSVCRLKIKWEDNKETIYNYRFPALIGECIEEYDSIFNYYYFWNNKVDHTRVEHNTRICKEKNK